MYKKLSEIKNKVDTIVILYSPAFGTKRGVFVATTVL